MLNPNLDDDEKYHSSSPNSALHESCDDSNEKIGTDKEIHAFRPRIIYCPMFVWGAVTTGKFVALFLRQLSPAFSDSMIGLTLSAQYAITACLAGWGGSLADASERKSARWGSGRVKVLRFAVLLGTLSFLGHEFPQFVNFGYQNISQKDIESEANFPWDFELVWHVFMRSLMAVSLAISAPSMDGLSLAHLECIKGSSQSDFGIERMYGAIFWGLGSLTVSDILS